MRRLLAGGLLGVALLAWAGAPRAVTVTGLYDAEVAVASQDPAERDRALRGALLEVVVRVSGQRQVPPTGVLSGAIQNPSRFVQELGYGAAPDASGTPRPSPGRSGRLWVRFDPAAINQLLLQAGLPVWGRSRPATLVWLAVERDGQRELLAAGGTDPLGTVVESRGRVRGVPVLLPAMDGEDRGRVRVDDVWSDLPDRVAAASRRYQADVVVLAQVRERIPGLWESRWTVVMTGHTPERYTVDGERVEKVVAEGVDRATDRIAARFAKAPVPEAAPAVAEGPLPDLVVTGVESFEAYTRARRQVEAASGVSAVLTVRLDSGRVVFRLRAQGDRDTITRALALGRTLVPVEASADWAFALVP
ncbi:MAG: DUF2066 domain-containing protein [Gammaproteobacteria bacterium]|nr:DUF2066 domain-containing protein [Gammaproteobacteria bacterium]